MYLPAICFFCSTLFVKFMKGDTLGDTASACGHPFGPCLISATVTVGSPVHAQISSWDHPPTQVQPSCFPFLPKQSQHVWVPRLEVRRN